MQVYFNGEYLEKDDVRIHPDDRGWLFADGIYEVVRVYNGCPFRLQPHIDRLHRSASEIGMSMPPGLDIAAVTEELSRRNGSPADATLYIQITRGVAPRTHTLPAGITPTVYIALDAFTPDPTQFRDGLGVLLVPDTRWARCDIKTINLLPNILAKRAAVAAGCGEAVFSTDRAVTEGTHTSVVSIRDGVVITSPISDNILPSITRSILLQLCDEANIPVHAEGLTIEGFLASDEAVLLGTKTEITPIREVLIDPEVGHLNEPVLFPTPGPLTLRLQAAYRAVIERECSRRTSGL